ncbi:MAG: dihydrodipicolinate synthase family protein [Acidimicrobiia bacterium]|nr:dihydrodipicolinate synthase family protein [Acidimicrobiia bacterium]
MSMPTGGFVAISVTPLDDGGAVDYEDLARLMQFYLDCGVDGVALLGVMGEANRMTDADARVVVEHAVAAIDGRVPIIVGVSDPSLQRVQSLGEYSMLLGCAGVLLQPLTGLRGDRAVAGYFKAAATALGPDVPICVQDFPKANNVYLSLDAWRMTLEECPSVIMLKLEDEPGLGKLSAFRDAEAAGMRKTTIFTGNNGIQLVQELGRGSEGAMTGFAFPDVLVRVIDLYASGLTGEAEDLFDHYLPVNRHELRTGIAVRKEILRRRGAIRTATARYPVKPLADVDLAELDGMLGRLEAATGAPITEIRSP